MDRFKERVFLLNQESIQFLCMQMAVHGPAHLRVGLYARFLWTAPREFLLVCINAVLLLLFVASFIDKLLLAGLHRCRIFVAWCLMHRIHIRRFLSVSQHAASRNL